MAEEVSETHVFSKRLAQVRGQKVKPRENKVDEISVPLWGILEVKVQSFPEQGKNILQSIVERMKYAARRCKFNEIRLFYSA